MRFFKTALLDILLLLAWLPLFFGMVMLLTHWQVQRSVRDANLLLARWSQLQQLPLIQIDVDSARLRWLSSPTQFWSNGWHSPLLQLVGVRLQFGHLTLAQAARVDVAGLGLWQMPSHLTVKMSHLHLLPQWWWPDQTPAQRTLVETPAFTLDLQWFYSADEGSQTPSATAIRAHSEKTHVANLSAEHRHAELSESHASAVMHGGRWQLSMQLGYQQAQQLEPVFQTGIEWQQMALLWQLLQQQQQLVSQLGWRQPSAAQWQTAWQQARWQRWQWQLQTPTTWPLFPQFAQWSDAPAVVDQRCAPVTELLKTVQQQWSRAERKAVFARFNAADLTTCY